MEGKSSSGRIAFRSKDAGLLSLRSGEFVSPDGRKLRTPYFFPIINIMTGPPDIFDNGGIFRHIKIELLGKEGIEGFMAQILHFTEFNVSSKKLDEWLETPIGERIQRLSGRRPFIFSDSGGYRLLYNTHLNLQGFDISPDAASILNLQTRFGADFLATLDYPILPTLSETEVKQRQQSSTRNSLQALELAVKQGLSDRMIFPVVHARNHQEMAGEVRNLLDEMETRDLLGHPFGIAIGSLVPLASSPMKALDVILGARTGLESVDSIDPSKVPIHAFGVSTSLMPFAALLGVDTFDGSTYVQSAQNLRFFKPGHFSSSLFFDVGELVCDCEWCGRIREGGLERAKEIIRGRSYVKHEFAGREIVKSEIYAMIALHNLENIRRQARIIRKAAVSEDAFEAFLGQISRSGKSSRMLHFMLRNFPRFADQVRKASKSMLADIEVSNHRRRRSSPSPFQRTLDVTDTPYEKSLELGPEDFNILTTRYRPAKKDLMILLPCTQTKPYERSTWHRAVRTRLRVVDVPRDRYEKVTISGNYGPVPEPFENDPRVLGYDFHLHSSDKERINLLAKRTAEFLEKHGSTFGAVLGYCTSLPYREVMRIAFEGYPEGVLLPVKPKARRASQFLKDENLTELVDFVLSSLG